MRYYSLCLLDGLRHGEEYAVDADGEHHDVVEVLVRAQVHAGGPDLEDILNLRKLKLPVE